MNSSVLARNNVQVIGKGQQTMMMAHGFGCDQNMWRLVTPAFENDFRIVLFDHVGSGRSDPRAYDIERHSSIQDYADDLLEICAALELSEVVYIGTQFLA
jgi:sigma-B regulation protein RsbQ